MGHICANGLPRSHSSKPGTERQRRTSLAGRIVTGPGARSMKSFGLRKYVLSGGVAVALLAGCGGSQPPIGAVKSC